MLFAGIVIYGTKLKRQVRNHAHSTCSTGIVKTTSAMEMGY